MSTRLSAGSVLLRPFVLPLLLIGAIALVAACSDDPNKNGAKGPSTTSNAIAASATPGTASTTGTTSPAGVISAATPVPTATVTPTAPVSAAAQAPTATPTPAAVSMTDLAPCAAQTYYSTIVSTDAVPTLAYQGVPDGTPILFPFEAGTVKLVDTSADGVAITYDVPGVGELIVGAADMGGLNRGYGPVARGQVIGHFGGSYPRVAGQPMPGYQAYAQVISVEPGANISVSGQAIEPQVGGCITP